MASLIITVAIAFFLIIPGGVLIFVGVKSAFQEIQSLRVQQAVQAHGAVGGGGWAGAVVSSPKIQAILERITQWFPIQIKDLTDAAGELTRAGAAKLADLLGAFITHLPGLVLASAVSVVSVYFFLIDGRRLVMFFRRNSVFSHQQTDRLIHTLAGTCRSVILASVVSGVAQSLLELVVCLAAQVPNAALVGLLVFLASFIPVIGAVPITVGVALQQFLANHEGTAIVLLAAAGVAAMVDNLIRPIFLRGTANLHPLLAFVAAFGGLQTLGFSGVFLGPIIAAMFVATVQMLFMGDEPVKSERPLL
jgi:predicted PurR-regulated permease PerM